jgi:hypothetical protein
MTLRVPLEWEADFEDSDVLVFAATDVSDDWDAVRAELTQAFELSQHAAREGHAITYIVHNDDLLGRRGACRAMVATGLLSAARTAAIELAKAGVPVNVLAIEDVTEPSSVARWTGLLASESAPTGELIHLGPGHIGKALA